jgi:prephenate dehydrogenase
MTQPGAQTIGAGKIPIPALEQARRELESAKKAMQQGDWENFGRAMEALQHSLTGAPE